MELRGDLHVHTGRSPDSRAELSAILAAANRAGLDFIALTDHDLPPEEDIFAKPERDGVLLVPGIEYTTDKGHLLGLFLEQPCPPSPGRRLPFEEAVGHIRACGGLAVLAHPFQSTAQTIEERLAMLREMVPLLDGIEVCNRRATKKRASANRLAEQAAETLFPQGAVTAGSDAHLPQEVGTAWLTVRCEEKSLPALRRALAAQAVTGWDTAPCGNALIAQSQKIKLQKAGASPRAWARWLAFWGLCQARDLRTKLAPKPETKG